MTKPEQGEQREYIDKDGRSHFRVTSGNCACGWTIINDFEWRQHLKQTIINDIGPKPRPVPQGGEGQEWKHKPDCRLADQISDGKGPATFTGCSCGLDELLMKLNHYTAATVVTRITGGKMSFANQWEPGDPPEIDGVSVARPAVPLQHLIDQQRPLTENERKALGKLYSKLYKPVAAASGTQQGELREVLLQVENWWLTEGMKMPQFANGAPAWIFNVRAALSARPERTDNVSPPREPANPNELKQIREARRKALERQAAGPEVGE